jgi:NADPH-dependent ferric siderophore reductase
MRDIHQVAVLERRDLTARMVRLTLAGPSLAGLAPRPAQDVEMLLPGDQSTVKRHYTIRHARPGAGEWDVDVLIHDATGPGSRWAARARTGDSAELVGPRGKLELRPAAHHLFVGDEASLPAIAALSEALPPAGESTAILQAYVLTEARAARAIRDLLRARGLDADRVFAKGYWNARA